MKPFTAEEIKEMMREYTTFQDIKIGENFLYFSEADKKTITMIKTGEYTGKPETGYYGMVWTFENPYAYYFLA